MKPASMSLILHLKTQRDQPYGSERRCCEQCGVMIWGNPDVLCVKRVFLLVNKWGRTYWTDDPALYGKSFAGLIRCSEARYEVA